MKEYLSPLSDLFIKYLFTSEDDSSRRILKSFINAVLEDKGFDPVRSDQNLPLPSKPNPERFKASRLGGEKKRVGKFAKPFPTLFFSPPARGEV